jgi:hypothetical protein
MILPPTRPLVLRGRAFSAAVADNILISAAAAAERGGGLPARDTCAPYAWHPVRASLFE